MVYFPVKDNNKNQEHVWVSHETAVNILFELVPDNLVLDGHDWTQGEITAKTSIHITAGFHASASNKTHIHLGTIDTTLLEPEEWSLKDKKQKSNNKKRTANSINISTNSDVSVYPNPTNGRFTVKNLPSSDKEGQGSVFITDITGKMVFAKSNINENELKIDISSLQQGIYILKIKTDNRIITHKIIKQ